MAPSCSLAYSGWSVGRLEERGVVREPLGLVEVGGDHGSSRGGEL